MSTSVLRRFTLAGALLIGLAGCTTGYGSRGYDSRYDRYYGDVNGYQAVPYGYAGSNFGWSGGYYYPGTGAVVYDRRGQSRAWSGQQRRYWERRAARRGHH